MANPIITGRGWDYDPAWLVHGASDLDGYLARVLATLGNRFSSLVTLPEQIGFFFTDESMYPPTLDGLAELIPETGLEFKWSGMIRFEDSMNKAWLQSMKDAGCYALFFGLESMSQRVQDIIKKGTSVDVAWRVLRDHYGALRDRVRQVRAGERYLRLGGDQRSGELVLRTEIAGDLAQKRL